MKNIYSIVLAFALVLSSTALFAQSQFGLRTGLAATTLSTLGDLPDNNHITYSYTAGAFYDFQVSKSVAFQTELNYVRKGRNNETSELNTSNPTDYLIHYLQVPVLFQYRDVLNADQPRSFFFVNAGPYAGFALSNQTRPSNTVQLAQGNKTDWGVTFGVGFQAPVGKKDLRFDLRYDMGFSAVANQADDFHTKGLSLTVGIVL